MSSVYSAWIRLWQNWHNNDPFAASPLRKAPYFVVAVFIALLHLGLVPVGNLVLVRGPQALPAFPGLGVDLVIVLVFGPRYWPVLLASYFVNSLWRQVPWEASCGVALAGLIRTLLGAALVCRLSDKKKLLGPFEDIAGIALAGLIATAVGAVVGASCLAAGGGIAASQWAAACKRWWIADALSVFITTPPLLALARSWTSGRAKWNAWLAVQCFLCLTGVSMACYLVFFRPDTRYLLFSVFLLILIAAAWLGPAAARFAAFLICLAAVCATRTGIGAFAGGTLRENLQNLALFVVAVSFTGMAVGAFRAIGNLTLPAGVLLVGWAFSGWLYASMDLSRASYDQARLDTVITSAETRIHTSYRAHEDLAWDAAGFLAASGRITPEDWHAYVSRLHLADRYPDVETLSVEQPADAELSVDSPSRASAERSRDSGLPALSRSAATASGSGAGFQLLVPVYRVGAPLTTAVERRSALLSWVSVAFRADPFFRSGLEDLRDVVRLRVSKSEGAAPGNWFFWSAAGPGVPVPPERITHLTLGGSTWTLGWSPMPGFPYLSRGPFALAAGCTALLSLLLAGLVLILQTTRRRASDRWKLLQSASALGTWEFDFNSEMVHCSEQLRRLYGIVESRERFPLTEWLGYIHPNDREGLLAAIGDRLENRPSIDRQYRVVWPDGSVHWLHSKALPVMDDQGQMSRIVGVDFDVSEIKQLQSQLAQAQKLQSVGQLAAGVAHEINTPIQYIGDNGKFLEDAFRDLMKLSDARRGASPLPPGEDGFDEGDLEYLRREVPKAATQLLEGVDQVTRIVRAMKEFSHPGPIERTSADINRAIANTILVSKNEWKYVAEVTTDLDPYLPPVSCVVGEFNQVILNLIVNAAHAISDAVGESNRKGAIHISTRQKESMLEVRVTDTGTGIPESIQSKVFDPFFTTKPVGKGTGQGLAIAHAVIVQKHHGSLTFESGPGRGTTFVIRLPLECELETV
ncbi:MAG: PAS domain-containing protein [Acidobacteriia bacterium]|nr:PAS domain-containing protein [Terriglobia bacterium]